MKIETKFSIGDKVYTMRQNEVYSFYIERIEAIVTPRDRDRVTFIYDSECKHIFNESACYASKEELLASLCPSNP